MGKPGDKVTGRALVVWADASKQSKMDDIDTDQITPSGFCVTTDLDRPDENWKAGAFRYLIPDFQSRIRQGENFLVVGKRFGIGSSREMSPAGIKAIGDDTGQEVIIICDARPGNIFMKNAVNLGLAVVVSPDAVADARDGHEFSFDKVNRELKNLTLDKAYDPAPLNAVDREILDAGGLIRMGRHMLGHSAADKISPPPAGPGLTYTQRIIRTHQAEPDARLDNGERVRVR